MKRKSRKSRSDDENIDLENPEFKKAWELLNYTRQSVFLTGKAGTGKSTFLRYITSHTRKKCVVLAPTGIAAVNAGGMTLHSFFRIPLRPILPDDPDFARDRLKSRMKYPGHLVRLIKELELIVIDEISMVRADLIDFIDKLLRHYSGNHREPFGGKQMLLVGDVFQLEPVVTADMREILRRYYPNPYFFSAKAFSEINLVPIELRKVYRQNQAEFIELLDRMRVAEITPADIATLNARYRQQAAIDGLEGNGKMAMTLASRRDMVDYINQSHLDAIRRPLFTFTGEIKGDFPENSLPTDMELSLKEGAQVVFMKNDRERRWVNGTLGTVRTLSADTLEVELESGDTYTVEPERWANIRYDYDSKNRKVIEKELGSFTQYPLKLAWALTIHKSQGLTFENAIIDIGTGAFAGGQTYVALSRCRSLEGLTLRSTVAERDIFVNPAIVRFSRTFNDPLLINGALEKAHADSSYAEAVRAADAGDFARAFDYFAEGLRSGSVLDNPVAMRYARRKFTLVNRLQQRIKELEEKIECDSSRFRRMALEYTSLGDDCLQDDMPQAALANFDKALALSPGLDSALMGKAKALKGMQQYGEAISALRQLLAANPSDFDALMVMAAVYEEQSDWLNAIDRYLAALDLRKDSIPLHEHLAVAYAKAGDKESANLHKTIARRLRRGK